MSEAFFGTNDQVESERAEANATASEEPVAPAETTQASQEQPDATAPDPAVAGTPPSLDVVRVDPDGAAVIAGSATPSSTVELFADDESLGTEAVGTSGDWVFVTDDALPTGGFELRVQDAETEQFASTSIMIVVQDDRSSEPLVIASEPGQAGEILQGLEDDAPAAAQEQVAQAPIGETEAARLGETPEPVEAPEPQATEQDTAPAAPQAPDDEQTLQDDMQVAAVEPDTSEDAVAPAGNAVENERAPADTEPLAEDTEGTAAPVDQTEDENAPLTETESVEETLTVAQTETEAEPMADTTPPASPAAASEGAAEPTPIAEDEAGPVETQAPQTARVEDAPIPTEAEPEETSAPSVPLTPAQDEPEPTSEAQDGPPLTAPVSEPAQSPEPEVVVDNSTASAPADEVDTPVPTEPQGETTPIAPPTIDAVEIDGDRNFFAGAGTEGMTVRLYVDNQIVGTTIVNDGRWLIEAIEALDDPEQRVRIDMIAEDGSVAGRAEVNFVLPEQLEQERVTVADQDEVAAEAEPTPAPMAPLETATPPETAPEPQDDAQGQAVSEPTQVPTAETASESQQAETSEATTQQPADAARPAPSSPVDEPVSEDTVSPDMDAPENEVSTPSVITLGETEDEDQIQDEASPESLEPAADTGPTPIAAPDDENVPTMVGISENGRTTSGLAIIRQGDNLWTIARRVYGEGIRYTQIYDANSRQIRDPDLIYPGQVFDLPGTDEIIGEQEDEDGAQ